MVNIKIGGSVDIQKIHRLTQENELLVGYPDGVQHPKSKIQNSDMARALHFGTRHIPARPWLYDTVVSVWTELREKMKKMYQKSMERGASQEVTGEFSLKVLGHSLSGPYRALSVAGTTRA